MTPVVVQSASFLNFKTMPLPRKATIGIFETLTINVYDIDTKKIIFTGSMIDVAAFMGVNTGNVHSALKTKHRIQKKWAVRTAKTSP